VEIPGVIYPPAHSSERIDPTSIPRYYVPEQVPINSTSTVYEKSHVVSSGAARLFGVFGYNSGAAQFVLVFDVAGSLIPADGAVPTLIIPAAATSAFSLYYGSVGRWFNGGIVLCNSSTGPTKTIGVADCWFDVQFV